MQNTDIETIKRMIAAQRSYFGTGATLDIAARKKALKALRASIQKHEKELTDALWTDLHKSYEEAYLCEISLVYGEIRNNLRHLKRWARPECVCSPISMFPARTRIVKEPLGNALIIAPWNYPVLLLLSPLVGALSAGCTAMLKPSPYTPHVAAALEMVIREALPEGLATVAQGNREVNTALLNERFDLIFFTGSPDLGKTVMAAAAKHLTPVVLELGGKSPCIIDCDANLHVAAKRIAWGKSLNAGQTCIAPDYLLIHKEVKAQFLELLKQQFTALLGDDPQKQKHFVRLVSDKAFDRVSGYLKDGDIIFGGKTDRAERYISPTLLDNVSPDTPVMQEEIFGPIFPILTFGDTEEAVAFVRKREKPLALYYFGGNGKHVVKHTSAGGSCINDTIMHIVNDNAPFGGVGNSGISAYHGKDSFLAFTHRRTVVTTPAWIDMPFRYMPYSLFKLVKELL